MGFKNLFPPFTVSKAFIDRDDEKLPTAQTCMNILRVPTYTSWKILREKLLIAIKSGAGFEFQ
jgi:Ubiquitin-protein ligase